MAQGIIGIVTLLFLAWLLSEDRRRIPLRPVIGGIALQWVLALLLIRFPPSRNIFFVLNEAVEALQRATDTGTSFVFGYLGGGAAPFDVTHPEAGFILAFKALPLVLVISALSSLLFYWGILQRVVGAFAWVLRRLLGVSGALGLGAAVHVFVGMTEAPLLVRPYLARMNRGEIFALMTVGMAGIAGTVMAIYAQILGPVIPDSLGNILIAAVISTPAGLAVAALMVPFESPAGEDARLILHDPPLTAMDAVTKGTSDGIGLLVSIAAMLLVLISLVTLVNNGLADLPHPGDAPISLQRGFALLLRPVVWLIGVPWDQSGTAAGLMATKIVLNEFVAYLDLSKLPAGALDPHARLIMVYAMCGFANFGSVGILIGGLGAMMPERRHEVVALGLRSLVSGTITTCLSGAVAGLL
jgi:concentrative nucleoside transporter, CNT family